jgi:hypothetical protein
MGERNLEKKKNGDLEDPLVHDDDGDVESPPLEDREHRADRGGARQLPPLRRRHRNRTIYLSIYL